MRQRNTPRQHPASSRATTALWCFFPSPSVFVYTLPNIVTGEIAIRNKFYGETSFYVLEHQDDAEINRLIAEAALDTATHSVIGGWLECAADDDFTADIWLYC
jgi:3-oxoacyl-[acyl-carrier-protein] synthase-1